MRGRASYRERFVCDECGNPTTEPGTCGDCSDKYSTENEMNDNYDQRYSRYQCPSPPPYPSRDHRMPESHREARDQSPFRRREPPLRNHEPSRNPDDIDDGYGSSPRRSFRPEPMPRPSSRRYYGDDHYPDRGREAHRPVLDEHGTRGYLVCRRGHQIRRDELLATGGCEQCVAERDQMYLRLALLRRAQIGRLAQRHFVAEARQHLVSVS